MSALNKMVHDVLHRVSMKPFGFEEIIAIQKRFHDFK